MTDLHLTAAQIAALSALCLDDACIGGMRLAMGTDRHACTINTRAARHLAGVGLVTITVRDDHDWAVATAAGVDWIRSHGGGDVQVVGRLEIEVGRSGLAALKAICACTATEPATLAHVCFGPSRVTATDTFVGVSVPYTLLGVVEGHLSGDVHVPAATLKQALWKVGKADTATVVVLPDLVEVRIPTAAYRAIITVTGDLSYPDVTGVIQRSADLPPQEDYTFIDAARMGQVAGVTPSGTTVVSRGALAAATVHDYLDADECVGVVMPVKADYRQPFIGEAAAARPPELFDQDQDDVDGGG